MFKKKLVQVNFNPQEQQEPITIVAISDVHNNFQNLQLPSGDILVITGDLTVHGTSLELKEFNNFLGLIKSHYKAIICIAGNHDYGLDPFYSDIFKEHYQRQKNQAYLEAVIESLSDEQIRAFGANILSNCTHYLYNSAAEVEGIKFYGSPQTIRLAMAFRGGNQQEVLKNYWSLIPDDIDVLLTHMPPYGVLDLCNYLRKHRSQINNEGSCTICNEVHQNLRHIGCPKLMQEVEHRIKPKLHIFGHIHEANGEKCRDGIQFVNAATKVFVITYYKTINICK